MSWLGRKKIGGKVLGVNPCIIRRLVWIFATILIVGLGTATGETPPFTNASQYHYEEKIDPWGVYKHAISVENIGLLSGNIGHTAFVDTGVASVIGFWVIDEIHSPFTVPASGNYLITYKGRIDGSFWNFTTDPFGYANGGGLIWLETEIPQILGTNFQKTLYKTDLSNAALINEYYRSQLTEAVTELADDPGFLGAIETIYSFYVPEFSWDPSTDNGKFSMISHVFLEAGEPYQWSFSVNSRTMSLSLGLAFNTTTFDVDVYLEEVSVVLLTGVGNNPVLYNPRVSPQSGTTVTTFEYLVDYDDVDGDSPDYVRVSIDGSQRDMTLKSGTSAHGTYRYTTNLVEGEHSYYFTTMDAYGGIATTGTYAGPSVGIGTGDDLSRYSVLRWEDDTPCDKDHLVESWEGADLQIRLRNNSNETIDVFAATLTTSDPDLEITDNEVDYGYIAPGQTTWGGDFSMLLDFSTPRDVQFTLVAYYMKDGIEYNQSWNFSVTLPQEGQPLFEVDHISIDDSEGGDNDGIPESGEGLEFDLYIKNVGTALAVDVELMIDNLNVGSTDDNRWYSYPDLSVGASAKQRFSNFKLRDIPRNYTGWVYGDLTIRCAGNEVKVIGHYPLFEVLPTAWLKVTPTEWNFGVSSTTNDIIKTIAINNIGSGDLSIGSITFSHSDTTWTGDTLPWTIPPGGSKIFNVNIETSALQGLISRSITVNVPSDVHIFHNSIIITGLVSDAVLSYRLPDANGSGVSYWIDASGNIIVWEDHNRDICAYDLTEGTGLPVCTNAKSQVYPRISGNLIVWEDLRNDDGSYTNCDIYGYDLNTGQEFIISNDLADEDLVGVDGNLVAVVRDYYIFTERSNWDSARNLIVFEYQGNGQVTQIYSTNFSVTPGHDPKQSVGDGGDFGSGLLVFERHEIYWHTTTSGGYWDSRNPHLEKIDYGYGEISPTDTGVNSWPSPYSAADHRFVYAKADAEHDDQIWLWDNGSQRQLTFEPVHHASEDNLSIGDGVVTYDKEDGRFYCFNLATNMEKLIAEMHAEPARMDGHLLVWGKRSTPELYYAFLNQADISVNSADIVFSDSQPYEGSTIDVNVTVHNLNPWSTTENITVRLYDGDPDFNGTQLGTDKVIVGGIVAQGSTTVTFSDVPANTEGTKNICAKVFVPSGDNPANNKTSKLLIVGDTDSQAPIITNVAVQEHNGDGDGKIEDDEQLLISWQATDDSGIKSSWCTIDANDYLASGTYYVVVGPYATGNYTFTISATDGDISSETSEHLGGFTVAGLPGDFEPDGDVDFADLEVLAEQWLQPPGTPSADIAPQPNGDGIVNFLDFALMAENWMK